MSDLMVLKRRESASVTFSSSSQCKAPKTLLVYFSVSMRLVLSIFCIEFQVPALELDFLDSVMQGFTTCKEDIKFNLQFVTENRDFLTFLSLDQHHESRYGIKCPQHTKLESKKTQNELTDTNTTITRIQAVLGQ